MFQDKLLMARPRIFTDSSSTNGKEFAPTNKIRDLILGKNKEGSEQANYLHMVIVTQNTGDRAEN